MSRATLNDLVEDFLRLELGYGEEFVVSSETGPIYDVEETENLSKKLKDLGELGRTSLRRLVLILHIRYQRRQLLDYHR